MLTSFMKNNTVFLLAIDARLWRVFVLCFVLYGTGGSLAVADMNGRVHFQDVVMRSKDKCWMIVALPGFVFIIR